MHNETHADKSHVFFTYMHVTIMVMIINMEMMVLPKAPIKTVELVSSVLAVIVVAAVVVVVVGGTVELVSSILAVLVVAAVVVGVVGGTTHGGEYRAHDRPAFTILPWQQPALLPGRLSQPLPPHFPQDLRQHTLPPSRMPDTHAKSVRVYRD